MDAKNLQKDLDTLVSWTEKWQLFFNFSKCEHLHIGNDSPSYSYTLAGTEIPLVENTSDLGVIFDSTLKFHLQTANVISKANQRLAIIRRCFTF